MTPENLFNKKRGFTLIEILVAIAIIGILAGIMLISLKSAREKVVRVKTLQSFNQIALAIQLYYDKYGHWPNVSESNNPDGAFSFAEKKVGDQENDRPDFVPEFYPSWSANEYCGDCKLSVDVYDLDNDKKADCGRILVMNDWGIGKKGTDPIYIYKWFLCLTSKCTQCGATDYYPQ